MTKTCRDCYWIDVCTEDKTSTCDSFSQTCGCGDEALVVKDGKMYCEKCALELSGIEISYIAYYHLDGEYLGDENEDIVDLIVRADCGFKPIKED